MNPKQFHDQKSKELEEISIWSQFALCSLIQGAAFSDIIFFFFLFFFWKKHTISALYFQDGTLPDPRVLMLMLVNNIHFWRNHTGTNLWIRPKKAHWEIDSNGSSLIVVPVFQVHRNSLSALSVWSRDLWLIIVFPMSTCLCFTNC